MSNNSSSKSAKLPKLEKGRTSLSLRPSHMDLANQAATAKHKGNITAYIASLIERDADGQLWLGTSTDTKNRKPIDELCRIWTPGSEANLRDAIGETDQTTVMRNLLGAFIDFASIHEAKQTGPHADVKEPDARICPLVIVSQNEARHLRRELQRCAEILRGMISSDFRDIGMPPAELKLHEVFGKLTWLENGVWLKDSNEAKSWLADNSFVPSDPDSDEHDDDDSGEVILDVDSVSTVTPRPTLRASFDRTVTLGLVTKKRIVVETMGNGGQQVQKNKVKSKSKKLS
jgi:hypothetical protein